MKKINIMAASVLALSLVSCNLNEMPVSTADKNSIFGSRNGLELYSNSFYNLLPSTDVGVFMTDDTSDIVARSNVDTYLATNALSAANSYGWDWEALRNINYFIVNCEASSVAEKNHYLGLARFFRAYFYFAKVKHFGNVPWIDRPFDVAETEQLKGPRDDRFAVMDKVLADLDYAIENITLESDPTCSMITKNVVRAYKTRICLWEASYRKYHTEYGKQDSANEWYQMVVETADQISGYSLHRSASPAKSYRELFLAPKPYADETILAVLLSKDLKVFSSANRRFISPTFGNRPSLTRNFVNTYLNIDGTPFTSKAGYKTMKFVDEVKDRDLRLSQTIRTGDYHRTENGQPVAAPANLTQSYTGYQPIKWCYDERFPYDDESLNDNAHIVMRWAEVLLNKAEALAELGRMTPDEWRNTIGALRERAGIANAPFPSVADPYMKQFYGGKFTDAVMLEVMRERAVEMIFEGLRGEDLRRWKVGELFAGAPMNGMYVPALGEYDLNADGVMDVYFYEGTKPTDETNPAIAFVDVTASEKAGTRTLSEGTKGEIVWNPGTREWLDKKYLYPIPAGDITLNPNLGQNEGW